MNSKPSSSLHANVLTLNRFYTVVHVISVKRAFALLFKDHAEVINVENGSYFSYDFASWCEISELRIAMQERCELEDWICAVNFEVQVPRVIRLLKYDRLPRNSVKFNRRNVFLRDGHRCQFCGKKYGSHNLSLDHVIPRSRGGLMNWENIVTACLKCNVRKGGRTPQEAGMKLLQPPKKPHRNPVFSHQLNQRKYESWRSFVSHHDKGQELVESSS